ncbi:MAG: hypothetical protein PHH54_02455 [Candidatus Nanoarchaeia archaeon]|nr:hypothetical protein [Candidatus Nanoarchaeia archaeon]MDD5740823.1 hypothetical protein [Candidatus Nanoarchaeia archaeon]
MKGVYYLDSKNRKTLIVPYVFIAKFNSGDVDIELEVDALKKRSYIFLKRDFSNLKNRLIRTVEIFDEDMEAIIDLSFKNNLAEAIDYCADMFDYVMNEGDLRVDRWKM